MEAIRHVEDVVIKAGGAALRYGALYGPVPPPTTRSSSCASGNSRSSVAAPATPRGCISTTRQAPQYWLWNSRRRACSTSSTTSPSRPANGALSGRVRGRKATDAGPQVAGPAAGRRSGGDDDDRGARLLQRQGQAGARLAAAL